VSERLLILAPRGRDAVVIEQVLVRASVGCRVCPDLGNLQACLAQDAGGLLVTEEALAGADLEPLFDWIEAQPPWSDIPVILLVSKQAGRRTGEAVDTLERLGNVVLLERPINAETLASAARSALRVRRRQYQARALFQQREAAEQALRRLNDTLEHRVEARTRELVEARETLAFALDSAGMGSWDFDLKTDTAKRSPQHDRLFGYAAPVATWGEQTFMTHVLEEDRDGVQAAFDRALEGGRLDVECRVRRVDGEVRWIQVQGRVEYDRAGEPVRMAGVLMDTTERRRTEDALHQAQKMEAIGQLTGGVAHDFNNLLTVIVGGLDMMIRRPDQPERVVRLAEAAMTAARRGEQLTQQLLAFSRRQVLRPETLNPNRLLLAFEALAQRAVGETVRLSFELDAGVDPVRIDPAQFESAVLNLIVNARDAMPEGGAITVRTRNEQLDSEAADALSIQPGAYVSVAVSDTGGGIDADTLSHAFEPFFTTKEVGKGSGLGLSQVYGFVRSAGGAVAIDTTVGVGTTVPCTCPAHPTQRWRSAPPAAVRAPFAGPRSARPSCWSRTTSRCSPWRWRAWRSSVIAWWSPGTPGRRSLISTVRTGSTSCSPTS
jgi:PAS domain S-box-containing protein